MHEAGDFPLYTAEVKNEWIYTSAVAVCLYGLYSDSYTVIFQLKPNTCWAIQSVYYNC
jgi:hypothetical protein